MILRWLMDWLADIERAVDYVNNPGKYDRPADSRRDDGG